MTEAISEHSVFIVGIDKIVVLYYLRFDTMSECRIIDLCVLVHIQSASDKIR